MPSDFLYIDTNFPTFSGRETTADKLAAVQNYLFMLLEQLRYTLNNLSTKNWNAAALEGFIDEIQAGLVVADTVISNTVITNVLAAENATIAELTVDQLDTSAKVQNYLAGNTADVNYIKIYGQTIRFITASTDGSAAEPAKDRRGNPLYWTDGTHAAAGTDVTAYPVTIYTYTELIKLNIAFENDNGTYIPKIVLGAGTGTNNNGKGFIYKGPSGLYLDYYSAMDGRLKRILLNDDGVVLSPYELKSIWFYNNGFTAAYDGAALAYKWTKDGSGRITKLTNAETSEEIPVTWNAGDM